MVFIPDIIWQQRRTMTIIIRTRFYDFIFTPLGFSYWVIFAGKRINGHDFLKLLFMVERGGIDWKVFWLSIQIWLLFE